MRWNEHRDLWVGASRRGGGRLSEAGQCQHDEINAEARGPSAYDGDQKRESSAQ